MSGAWRFNKAPAPTSLPPHLPGAPQNRRHAYNVAFTLGETHVLLPPERTS